MQKLGYIISQTKIRDIADFIEVTNDLTKYDSDKPSLIVGLEYARNKVEGFSIIKKNPKPNKFWTFGKMEKRMDFEKDTKKFYDYVLNRAINDIKYYYVDVTKLSKRRIRNLFRLLLSDIDKYIYIYKGMLYLYYQKYILGISLTLIQYCQIDIEKWLKRIKNNKTTKIYYTDSDIDGYMKQYAKNRRYIIPFFYSLLD